MSDSKYVVVLFAWDDPGEESTFYPLFVSDDKDWANEVCVLMEPMFLRAKKLHTALMKSTRDVYGRAKYAMLVAKAYTEEADRADSRFLLVVRLREVYEAAVYKTLSKVTGIKYTPDNSWFDFDRMRLLVKEVPTIDACRV